MTKNELVTALAERMCSSKRDAEVYLNAFIDIVGETLEKGEDIKLVGFGNFSVKERSARVGRNPRNPQETIDIPASKSVGFKVGKTLKDRVNK